MTCIPGAVRDRRCSRITAELLSRSDLPEPDLENLPVLTGDCPPLQPDGTEFDRRSKAPFKRKHPSTVPKNVLRVTGCPPGLLRYREHAHSEFRAAIGKQRHFRRSAAGDGIRGQRLKFGRLPSEFPGADREFEWRIQRPIPPGGHGLPTDGNTLHLWINHVRSIVVLCARGFLIWIFIRDRQRKGQRPVVHGCVRIVDRGLTGRLRLFSR